MKTMTFNNAVLRFDRTANCDWCGKRTMVGITHYGTQQYYNRLVCEKCAELIVKHDEALGLSHTLSNEEED